MIFLKDMKNKQTYTAIESIINGCIVFKGISYEDGDISIYLEQDDKKIKIFFEGVLFYSLMDEGNIVRIFEESNFIGGNTLYQVDNSKLIDIFNYCSYNCNDDLNIEHFSIYTQVECIEVLTGGANPVVNYIN